jgi:hypothetical protein
MGLANGGVSVIKVWVALTAVSQRRFVHLRSIRCLFDTFGLILRLLFNLSVVGGIAMSFVNKLKFLNGAGFRIFSVILDWV